MDDPIKVLIVDDALFMRKAISEILQSDKSLEVVGTARDGLDGLEKIRELQPHVVTLDIDMPRMDGLAAIRHIMIESPVPVVVLSSLFSDGAVTFEALRLGVVDFVPKPSGGISEDMDKSRREIIDRVKIASGVNFENIRRVRMQNGDRNENLSVQYGFHPLEYLITLGTSLSGPNTVIRLLTRLSPTLPAAMVVVQEIAPQILPAFVRKFNQHVPWNIAVAQDGLVLEQGVCYICSNTQAVRIDRNENDQPCICLSEPVAQPLNELFISAAEVFRQNTIGVLLTGIGDDGADGFARIRGCKGNTIAQDSRCCVYPNLTHNAIEKGTVNTIVDETQLPYAIAASIP
ncbi:MAG: response regulator [Desulfobacteraceae bacterium]|nr:MAG: response regulator [Desulfobacteraceae bacterium]